MREVARAAVHEYIDRTSRRELLGGVLDEQLPRTDEALRRLGEVIFLDLEDLLHIARRTLGIEPVVRDHGLLESALARPQASAFGADAYPSIEEKAAALLHSLARNHALVDGNKRLALAATIAFLGINDRQLTFSNDQAAADLYVIAVATGKLDEVPTIASVQWRHSKPAPALGRADPCSAARQAATATRR